MLNRTLTFAAGFFVYVASLLCFVRVPPQISKPQLAGAFAAVALICATIVLGRRRFAGWGSTLAAILIGGSLMSVVAVGTITVLRKSDSVRQALPAGQLDGFSDYTTGIAVALILLIVGVFLSLVGRLGKKV